jgi:hypothetical protein
MGLFNDRAKAAGKAIADEASKDAAAIKGMDSGERRAWIATAIVIAFVTAVVIAFFMWPRSAKAQATDYLDVQCPKASPTCTIAEKDLRALIKSNENAHQIVQILQQRLHDSEVKAQELGSGRNCSSRA